MEVDVLVRVVVVRDVEVRKIVFVLEVVTELV